MNKLSNNYLFLILFLLGFNSLVKADVEITPVFVNSQNNCNNYISVRFDASGFTDLITLDYGISWDSGVLEYAGYNIISEPGMNTPTINISMVSSGAFGYYWSDLDNTGESIPTGTALIEILFKVTGSAIGTQVSVEDIMGLVNNEAYDLNFDPVVVIGNAALMDLNAPVSPELLLNYQILKSPNGCNDSLQIAVKIGQCFYDLASVQFSLSWDATKFLYLSNSTPYFPGGDAPIINTTQVFSNGRFGYGWGAISNPTSSAPDNTTLLVLTFKTVGVGTSVIQANNNPLLIEVIDQNYETIGLTFAPSSLNVSTNNYFTVADGTYYSPATWQGGCVPSNPVPTGTNVNINHNLSLPVADNITNFGTINCSLPFINYGTYQGTGVFNGSLINNGNVKPGDF